MELWATGFNAWGQLDFTGKEGVGARDLKTFKCVFEDEYILVMRATLSATLIETSKGLRVIGSPDSLISHCIAREDGLPESAIAGNGQVCAIIADSTIVQYPYFMAQDSTILAEIPDLERIVANQTTFTALTKAGDVYTWGDGRYPNLLGRDVEESPASTPSLVEDLLDLPTGTIRKISSGGYLTAALTTGNDLYVWGGRAGQKGVLKDLESRPMPVDLAGVDVLDVAVGMNHILALSTERKLYVAGSGGNGQLGVDVEGEEIEEWKEVILSLNEGQRIASVFVGYKNSFVLVENGTWT